MFVLNLAFSVFENYGLTFLSRVGIWVKRQQLLTFVVNEALQRCTVS